MLHRSASRLARAFLGMLGVTSVEKQLYHHRVRLPLEGHPFREVLFNKNYWQDDAEADYLGEVLHCIRPGDTVFDIGAFRGQFTVAMALKTGPGGQVLSFEPNPDSFNLLQQTLRLNEEKLGHVQLLKTALSDEEKTARLTPRQGGSTLQSTPAAIQGIPVQVTTLDAIVQHMGHQPRLLKVDVEGYEYKVLAGGQRVLEQCEWVCCEVHPAKMKAASGRQVHEIIELLEQAGYEVAAMFEPEKHLKDPGRPHQVIFKSVR